MGVLHSVVTNHKFNQIFLRRMNNTTNFRSKFRVAFTPSRNLSPKVRAVQNNTCLENSRKCRRSFVSVKNSSKSQEFRRISSTGKPNATQAPTATGSGSKEPVSEGNTDHAVIIGTVFATVAILIVFLVVGCVHPHFRVHISRLCQNACTRRQTDSS